MKFPALLALSLTTAGPVLAEAPRVAVDIAPVHSLVAQVMEGAGTPDLIIPAGASPHHYALRPSEASALSAADVVVWMGPGLTPWLEGPIEALAGDALHLALLEAEVTGLLARREGVAFGSGAPSADEAGGHDDGHGHDDGDKHADTDGHDSAGEDHGADAAGQDGDHGHGHDHGDGPDPHAWLDPVNAQAWLDLIARELAALDPENAALYRGNAAAAIAALDRESAEIDRQLAGARKSAFMVLHDAYQYFETRFDIRAAAAISLGDAARPGPARLAELRALAAARDVDCVLVEPQLDPKLAQSVLGSDHATGMLDPLGATLAPGPEHYTELLRALGAGFASCAR